MINITEKHKCCGCGACAQKCPKKCISLREDIQGFLYPQVDDTICINCGICEKVCPIQNPYISHAPLQTLVVVNNDFEVRMASSSGGVFTAIAEKIINEGGVVFGARYDEEWQVTLDYTEVIEGLAAFRGSKYVQARTSDTYKKCEKFLKDGRKVLFTGTHCQISALKHFLNKEYDNLYTVDFVCHGVPSPLVWKKYLETHKYKGIKSINFRDKSESWQKFGLRIDYKSGDYYYEPLDINPYLKVFLNDLSLRPSCFSCSARSGASNSDLTIADFWRIEEHENIPNSDKGVSCAIVQTEKGYLLLQDRNLYMHPVDYSIALQSNLCIEKSVHQPKEYNSFWKSFLKSGVLAIYRYSKINRESISTRLYKVYKKVFSKI